jgi:hypothetical protein
VSAVLLLARSMVPSRRPHCDGLRWANRQTKGSAEAEPIDSAQTVSALLETKNGRG